MVAQAGIEPATPRSSGECSTTELPGQVEALYSWKSTERRGRFAVRGAVAQLADERLRESLSKDAALRDCSFLSSYCGAVAQLIERCIRIAEVVGLIPISSTIIS